MSLHALILAGGQGSRLGLIRKDQIRLGGISLLDRVKDKLHRAEAKVMVSAGRQAGAGKSGALVVQDLDLPIGGPIAGLIAAAAKLGGTAGDDLLVSVAVDTPFLPDDFVRRLVAALHDGALAAQAAWQGNTYPTNAIWRLSALAELPTQARNGAAPKSPKALLAQLDAVTVDWADTHTEDPFANLNTLDDLVALARRACMTAP